MRRDLISCKNDPSKRNFPDHAVIILIDYDTDAYDAYGVVSSGFAEVIQLMPLIPHING